MYSSIPLHRLQRIAGYVLNFQRRVRKWPVLLLSAMWISSCASPPIPAGEPGTLPWRGNESEAYRIGHKDGSGDQRAGRPHAPRAGQGGQRADYLLGYGDGYRHPSDNPWSRPRAYQLGRDQGQQDQRAGRPRDPGRHEGRVPRSVRDEFLRGYREVYD